MMDDKWQMQVTADRQTDCRVALEQLEILLLEHFLYEQDQIYRLYFYFNAKIKPFLLLFYSVFILKFDQFDHLIDHNSKNIC